MSPELIFRCPPEWVDILPKPFPGKKGLPDWLKSMPSQAHSALLDQEVRTVKHCPPFIDAMGGGWMMPLPCDVLVEEGLMLSWDWDLPPAKLDRLTRSPIAIHTAAQAKGVPFAPDGQAALKFNNPWTIEAPDGWSILFTHPVNRLDLPFMTLTGLVDCDSFSHGFVHFPALWTNPDWTGVLKKGTPIAQLWPVPREMTARFDTLEGSHADKALGTLEAISEERGGYRKRYRASEH